MHARLTCVVSPARRRTGPSGPGRACRSLSAPSASTRTAPRRAGERVGEHGCAPAARSRNDLRVVGEAAPAPRSGAAPWHPASTLMAILPAPPPDAELARAGRPRSRRGPSGRWRRQSGDPGPLVPFDQGHDRALGGAGLRREGEPAGRPPRDADHPGDPAPALDEADPAAIERRDPVVEHATRAATGHLAFDLERGKVRATATSVIGAEPGAAVIVHRPASGWRMPTRVVVGSVPWRTSALVLPVMLWPCGSVTLSWVRRPPRGREHRRW